MREGLFDLDARSSARYQGSTALVLHEAHYCPRCGADVRFTSHDQPALFLHGGYGATLRVTTTTCARGRRGCGWSRETEVREVSPLCG